MQRSKTLAVLVLAGCQAGSPDRDGVVDPVVDPLRQHCRELLAAEPQDWVRRIAAAHAHGPAAAPVLVDALSREPSAPGAQPAVALLGEIGDAAAQPFLEDLVMDRGALATEAAIALGELQAEAAAETLVACATDRFADATLRAAAACAAVRVGQRRAVAAVLRGVVLAGTPAGQSLQRELGLPDKPRWAYERYLIQRLLRQQGAEQLMFDTDASWPALERAADRLSAWLLRD